jgi:phosphoribosylformylglycinamidine (FGAM) synthase-like enzyme/phosphoribosylformylglycinamidine (FGAM) synthase PurS component
VTRYTIEVRAIAERYDILAQQVARELLLLPGPDRGKAAYPIRTAHLYHLTGSLSPSEINRLTRELFIDPITQQATISTSSTIIDTVSSSNTSHKNPDPNPSAYHTVVDVFFHPGVTDTLAESILSGAAMLGIDGLERVETGQRYFFDGCWSEEEVRLIAESLLYNAVIQEYRVQMAGTDIFSPTDDLRRGRFIAPTADLSATDFSGTAIALADKSAVGAINRPLRGDSVNTIPLTAMSDEELMEVSRRGMLALNLEEMRAIQRYYRERGREPSDVELEMLAQTWSEHCSHKTFKATIDYREVDGAGRVIEQETIEGLLRQYIMRATQQVARPWVVSAFSDNAGIVRFTETQDIAFKVETHNHPSAIEPFGGANTGVGGVIRDVLGVSAQPIACTDILCFGPPDTPAEKLPHGVLSPHRIASGVVNGVRDYGNKMGIPTVNGAILYHPGYIYNPLVFCGCLGILPHGSHPHAAQPGDAIVVLGGRTGRDGIHGATFSSGEMSKEITAQAGSAVQIGAPITEKKVADVIIQARDRRLYHAITDCGAGGFSSAIGEMAAGTGAYVELDKAPLKYQGLAPWEIWLSEAQERMVLAVPPQHLDEMLDLCAIEEVEASIPGSFTDTRRLVISYGGQIVADMEMSFLHDGRPARKLEAVWVKDENGAPPSVGAGVVRSGVGTLASPAVPVEEQNRDDDRLRRATQASPPPPTSTPAPTEWREPSSAAQVSTPAHAEALLRLLRHPTIGSKEEVVRRYDHEVQGGTVLKPLVGRAGNGPGDAAVLQPVLEDGTRAGIVLSNGVNPLYGQVDPYWMAMNAFDEALRNLVAVGGDIERAAILDNFCWGNPGDAVQLGMLVRAVKGCYDAAVGFGVPFISGKDSLNNEYRHEGERLPVIPTLLISAVGVIDDAAQTVDMSLKSPGNLLYLVGITRNELGGSHYLEVTRDRATEHSMTRAQGTAVPHVDTAVARVTMQAVGSAIREGLVRACHDLSEGGLAVAAAEMSLAGLLGVSLDLREMPHEAMEMEREDLQTVLLFSESASRFLVEIAPEQRAAFEEHMSAHEVKGLACLGRVTDNGRFVVREGAQVLIDVGIEELQAAWKGERA